MKKLNTKKIIVLVVLVIVLIFTIWRAVARFESSATGVGEIEIAMYVVEEDYQTMNISLDKMVPREDPYVYNFTISNYNNETRTEVDIEYTLKIRTTTNIPLGYELYLEQNYDDIDAEDIILTNTIEADEDGTYFRKITTSPREFFHQTDKTDTYQLIVYFPSMYTNIEYQNLIESVEIIVEAKQIVE